MWVEAIVDCVMALIILALLIAGIVCIGLGVLGLRRSPEKEPWSKQEPPRPPYRPPYRPPNDEEL